MLAQQLALRLTVCVAALFFAAPAFSQDAPKEVDLIAILKSDAPEADKAITCKRLAIYGSKEAVPELAKLLSNEHLASWARIALEAIPGAEADDALLEAMDSLDGRLLVGTINSLGVRHPEKAVEKLAGRLKDNDVNVASAAAVALGHIGNADATQTLQNALQIDSLAVRSATAEGCVLCAERLLADGKADEAIELYDLVRETDLPKQRILEATRGAIVARKDKGIDLLVQQLRSTDRDLFRIGLSTARELPGNKVDQALADELGNAEPRQAALILTAMADRPETVKLPAVLTAAEQGPKEVRLAAVGALGRIGNATCLGPLLEIALESDEDLVAAARTALSDLPGKTVNEDIVKKLDGAKGKMYPLLIELVGTRRISAVPELLKALDNDDKEVRATALRSLGATVSPQRLSVLIAAVVKPKHPEDATVAQAALKEASVRMPDREATAEELAAGLKKAPAETKPALLEILGAVAGTNALHALADAAKSDDEQLQDTSTKLLGEWMTIDAAPVLLDLTKSAPGEKYQSRAFRGYVRIARQFIMPDAERIEMCRKAFEAARQPNDRKLVLDALKRPQNQSFETLKLAVETANKDQEIKDDAIQAALTIAASPKLGDKLGEVAGLLDSLDLPKVKLEIVKAEYGAGGNQKDVTDVVKEAAGERQWIALPKASYNESFGGDPAPNTPKKLVVHYRLNGKEGEASFGENSLVILPLPK